MWENTDKSTLQVKAMGKSQLWLFLMNILITFLNRWPLMEVARKYQFLAAMSQKLPVRLMYVRFVSMICRFQVEDVIF
jgi:hypothetical protein